MHLSPTAAHLLARLRIFRHMLRLLVAPERVRVTFWNELGERKRVRVPFRLAWLLVVKCWGDWQGGLDEVIVRFEYLFTYTEDGKRYQAGVCARHVLPVTRVLDPRLHMQLSCVRLTRLGGAEPLAVDVLDGDLVRLSLNA